MKPDYIRLSRLPGGRVTVETIVPVGLVPYLLNIPSATDVKLCGSLPADDVLEHILGPFYPVFEALRPQFPKPPAGWPIAIVELFRPKYEPIWCTVTYDVLELLHNLHALTTVERRSLVSGHNPVSTLYCDLLSKLKEMLAKEASEGAVCDRATTEAIAS